MRFKAVVPKQLHTYKCWQLGASKRVKSSHVVFFKSEEPRDSRGALQL